MFSFDCILKKYNKGNGYSTKKTKLNSEKKARLAGTRWCCFSVGPFCWRPLCGVKSLSIKQSPSSFTSSSSSSSSLSFRTSRAAWRSADPWPLPKSYRQNCETYLAIHRQGQQHSRFHPLSERLLHASACLRSQSTSAS